MDPYYSECTRQDKITFLVLELVSSLEQQDEFIQLKTTQILTVLLGYVSNCYSLHVLTTDSLTRSTEPDKKQRQYVTPFLNSVSTFIAHPLPEKRDVAVLCLEAVLPREEFRKAVWSSTNIISG